MTLNKSVFVEDVEVNLLSINVNERLNDIVVLEQCSTTFNLVFNENCIISLDITINHIHKYTTQEHINILLDLINAK